MEDIISPQSESKPINSDIAGEKESKNDNIFSDIKYICNSTTLITDALQNGRDVAQLPNGDIIITEVVTVNILYSWDKIKQKMVKISQS